MEPNIVIVLDALPQDGLSFFKTVEDRSIQKFVSEGVVKDFIKALLLKAPLFNVNRFDPNVRQSTA